MNFLRKILLAYREAALMAQYDFAASDADWTVEDSTRLRGLMEGTTGYRLKARLINFRARCAIEATRQPNNHAYHAGIAHGVAMTIGEIEASFATPMRNKETIEDEAQSVATILGFS